jgi:CheY-like chemotaxis protein
VPREEIPAVNSCRILVVEDKPDTAESLQRFLELAGHQVKVANTGHEGLDLAREWLPDWLLCDIGLPGLSGWDVARALQRCRETARIRLIAITGYGSEADKLRSREAGFEKHLVKPVDPTDLLGLLESGRLS